MKIIIVGGGTAGWICALFLSKIRPDLSITVVESSSIGIIGAGEGSTGVLLDIINNNIWNFGCNLLEFLQETNATVKYGIKHQGWTGEGSCYIGPLDGSETGFLVPDSVFAYAINSNEYKNDLHKATLYGNLIDNLISPLSTNTGSFNIDNHALHFDAHLVGKYFKKKCGDSVVNIDGIVTHCDTDQQGFIESINLEDGRKIYGDFFIDASGFSRSLIKTYDIKWCSYSAQLPVNTAMPFLLSYENESIEPYTTAWAHDCGWQWQIPLQNRKGCGYVFCDNFISADQAHAEIERRLNRKIDPIRLIKFDSGRLKKVWEKNCLAIGLAAAFLEPLEATSIHSTVFQILKFVFEFCLNDKNSTCNHGSIELYNTKICSMYDDFKDFLICHYKGGRTDTEFWRYMSSDSVNTEFVEHILYSAKNRLLTTNDFPSYPGSAGWHLWSYVLHGTKQLTNKIDAANLNPRVTDDAVNRLNNLKNKIEFLKKENVSYKDFFKYIKH
jgi:tryptophan halogenase